MAVKKTKEQIEAANKVDLPSFLSARGYALKRIGRSFCLKEHDSLRITGNKWNWFSQNTGGDSIKFLREYEGLSFADAVTELCGEQTNHAMPIRDVIITPPCSNEEREIKLPLQADNNKRAYRIHIHSPFKSIFEVDRRG